MLSPITSIANFMLNIFFLRNALEIVINVLQIVFELAFENPNPSCEILSNQHM